MSVVVSAGLNGSYVVGEVVGPNTLSSDRAAALCGKTDVDAVVCFPRGKSGFYGGKSGFYASFNQQHQGESAPGCLPLPSQAV